MQVWCVCAVCVCCGSDLILGEIENLEVGTDGREGGVAVQMLKSIAAQIKRKQLQEKEA